MGALKKMTRCGSISTLFGVLIVLFGVSSSALTTFGKTQTQNQPAPQATRAPVIAKECVNHGDCATIVATSCVQAADGKMRCLCGDFEAPENGYCKAKYKGLNHLCTDTMQCDIGMICGMKNVTTKTTTLVTSKTFMTSNMLHNNNTNYKMCLCDKELGYVEDKHDYRHCNGAVPAVVSATLLVAILGSTVLRKPLNHWFADI